jgi:hypothetical protein
MKWEDSGVVEKFNGNSDWYNPLLVAPKPGIDGSIKGWRVCIDPRQINNLIESVNYPLPLIKDIRESFAGMRVFSKADLTWGFH